MKITAYYYYSDSLKQLPEKMKKIKIHMSRSDTELIVYHYGYTRDSLNRLIRIESYYNENTKPLLLDLAYDSIGRVISWHEHHVNGYTPWYDMTFFYDKDGNMVKITNRNSHRSLWVDYLANYNEKRQAVFQDFSPEGKGIGSTYRVRNFYNSNNLIYKSFIEFIYTEEFRTVNEYTYEYY